MQRLAFIMLACAVGACVPRTEPEEPREVVGLVLPPEEAPLASIASCPTRTDATFEAGDTKVLTVSACGVDLVDAATGQQRRLTDKRTHRVALSHDGTWLALARAGGRTVLIGNVNDAESWTELEAPEHRVTALRFSNDDELVVAPTSTAKSGTAGVTVWSRAEGKKLSTLTGSEECRYSLAVSDDAAVVLRATALHTSEVASGCVENQVVDELGLEAVHQPNGAKLLQRRFRRDELWQETGFALNDLCPIALQLTTDGRRALYLAGTWQGYVFDLETGGSQLITSDGRSKNARFAPDGEHVLVWNNIEAKLVNSSDGRTLWTAGIPLGPQRSTFWREPRFSRDGRRALIFVGTIGTVVLDMEQGRVLHAHNARRPGIVHDIASAGDRLLVIATDGGVRRLHVVPF